MSKPVQWVKRWGYEMQDDPVRPGIYRLKDGGWFLTAKITDPATGRRRNISQVLRDAVLADAVRERDAMIARETAPPTEQPKLKPLFATFARDLLRQKLAIGDIKSESGRQKWTGILANHLIPAFGLLRVDELTREHLDAWQLKVAEKVKAGELRPSTVNTWIDVLRVITAAAAEVHSLPKSVAKSLPKFDTSTRPTYTEEEPNSMLLEETRAFLERMRQDYPQHYAMTLLGLVTGLRPSHMRPLRRRGPEADVLWKDGVLLIRRSHSAKQEVMNTTKTTLRQRIGLPQAVMDVLQWHVDTQLKTPKQAGGDLLFPSRKGGFRYNSVLDKPFAAVCDGIKIRKHITPRAMRRTYQDLCRAAHVADLVVKSVSGHMTDEMREHYSTVSAREQREGLARVVDLLTHRAKKAESEKMSEKSREGAV